MLQIECQSLVPGVGIGRVNTYSKSLADLSWEARMLSADAMGDGGTAVGQYDGTSYESGLSQRGRTS